MTTTVGIILRIVDGHTHLEHHHPEHLLNLADYYHCAKICVMGIPCYPQYNNRLNALECLLMKRLAPERVYVFNSMAFLTLSRPRRKPTKSSWSC